MDIHKMRRELAHRIHYSKPWEFAAAYRWLNLQPGEYVCDVGCGDGHWTNRLSGEGRCVIGIDLDPQAVARARRYYSHAAEFLVASGCELPLDDRTADKLFSLSVLQLFPDDAQGLREFGRVLRCGGRLCMSVDSLSLPWIDEEYRAFEAQRYHVRHLYTHTSIQPLLEAAGFELRSYKYVGVSRLACWLIQLEVKRGWRVNYLAPLTLPISRLADAATGQSNQGYMLVLYAEKVGA